MFLVLKVNRRTIWLNYLLPVALLTGWSPLAEAKSYSSGGRSYSSSSHSSSSGGSHSSSGGSHGSSFSSGSKSSPSVTHSGSGSTTTKSSPPAPSHSSSPSGPSSQPFTSSGGKSYGSGSTWSDENRKSYTSGKSYASGSAPTFNSSAGHSSAPTSARKVETAPSTFTFDAAAARARKEEASQREFTRFKEASAPKPAPVSERPIARTANSDMGAPATATPFYRVTPPPLPPSASGSARRAVYIPDDYTLATRPVRVRTFFSPYVARPVVVYRDPYNSFFWWWLLDRSLDDRAYWAYHHRYDMDPARYQALVADNRELETRIEQLENQQVPRNPNYAPPNLDRDLMYSDQSVTRAYSNRPTRSGAVAFWALAIPAALGAGFFIIWLVFFKRWQTATT